MVFPSDEFALSSNNHFRIGSLPSFVYPYSDVRATIEHTWLPLHPFVPLSHAHSQTHSTRDSQPWNTPLLRSTPLGSAITTSNRGSDCATAHISKSHRTHFILPQKNILKRSLRVCVSTHDARTCFFFATKIYPRHGNLWRRKKNTKITLGFQRLNKTPRRRRRGRYGLRVQWRRGVKLANARPGLSSNCQARLVEISGRKQIRMGTDGSWKAAHTEWVSDCERERENDEKSADAGMNVSQGSSWE